MLWIQTCKCLNNFLGCLFHPYAFLNQWWYFVPPSFKWSRYTRHANWLTNASHKISLCSININPALTIEDFMRIYGEQKIQRKKGRPKAEDDPTHLLFSSHSCPPWLQCKAEVGPFLSFWLLSLLAVGRFMDESGEGDKDEWLPASIFLPDAAKCLLLASNFWRSGEGHAGAGSSAATRHSSFLRPLVFPGVENGEVVSARWCHCRFACSINMKNAATAVRSAALSAPTTALSSHHLCSSLHSLYSKLVHIF